MAFNILYSIKNTFYYNFLPSKEFEDISIKSGRARVGREMVEIRDIFPPPVVSDSNPWRINKTLNHYEIESGKLIIPCNDMFEHVLRYWSIDSANYIAKEGQRVHVAIFDCTQDPKYPRKYKADEAYLLMVEKDDFVLACMALIKDRNLKVYDEISLYWDLQRSCFMFKLLK
ncbi:hypothetical protein PHJA_002434800 [Phtheirospermum japonicum]|uniref:Uncharacterized protein n=1 Tax=Phtheirospermum japonicum TaxID=374723 RepID=A0A830CV63_9LAMI|nr:hypothetical protein PHJA_002434800 [Phtheirospermum japonicum]